MVLRKKQKQEKAFIAMPPSSSSPLAVYGKKEENTVVAPALLEANSDLECAKGGAFFSGTAEAARSSSTIPGRGKCDVNPGLAPDGAAVAPAPVHLVSRLRGGADDGSYAEDNRCLPCSSSSGGDRRAADPDREFWARSCISELATLKHRLRWLVGLVSMSSFRI